MCLASSPADAFPLLLENHVHQSIAHVWIFKWNGAVRAHLINSHFAAQFQNWADSNFAQNILPLPSEMPCPGAPRRQTLCHLSVYDYSMNLFMNDFWSALKTHFFHWHCPVPWNIISPRILTPCDGVCVRARVYHRVLNLMVLFLQSRFTFTETIRTIRDGEPRAATSTWSSEMLSGIGVWKCIMPPCGVNMHVLAWNWKWNWKFMRIVTFYFQSLIHPWGRSNAKSPQSL